MHAHNLPPTESEATPGLTYTTCDPDDTWKLTTAVLLHGKVIGYLEKTRTAVIDGCSLNARECDWYHVVLRLPRVSDDLPDSAICQGHAETAEEAVFQAIDKGMREGQAFLLSMLSLKSAISTVTRTTP